MNALAVAGSLRSSSINAAFCRAAAHLAPPGLRITVCDALATLPPFNADSEPEPPGSVRLFRETVGATNALIIASPEYAHGISGVLKNALDWLVGCERFVGMPVAVINTSPRAHHAYDSLLEILETMSATLVQEASISVSLLGNCITEAQMVSTPAIALQIRGALVALNTFLQVGAQPGPSFPVESR
jgi:NAD(P)H-dependent FMN reductase